MDRCDEGKIANGRAAGNGLGDWFNVLLGQAAGTTPNGGLTERDMTIGLRAALETGVQFAVRKLVGKNPGNSRGW